MTTQEWYTALIVVKVLKYAVGGMDIDKHVGIGSYRIAIKLWQRMMMESLDKLQEEAEIRTNVSN